MSQPILVERQLRRRAFQLPLRLSDRIVALALFIGFLALRLPFLSSYLINWDAVQFALGTREFDLHHHQPHPPGYIGYIYLGRLLNLLTGEPNTSLTILSAVCGAIVPAAFYQLARHWVGRLPALAAAVMLGGSCLLWYYSEVALTYAVEAALSMLFILAAYHARRAGSVSSLWLACLTLGLLGGVRQTGMVLLLPLWLYVVWAFDWRIRRRAGLLLGITCALWLGPLLWLSGGLSAYLAESAALARLVGGETSALTLHGRGLMRNAIFVFAGIVLGLNIGLALIVAAGRRGGNLDRLSRSDRWFLLIWALPALATFLLGHTGQLGYVLLILPIAFLWLALVLETLTAESRADSWARPRWFAGQPAKVAGIVLTFALLNAAVALALPGVVVAGLRAGGIEPDNGVILHLRQYDLGGSDTHWQELTELIEGYDSQTTAVLTTIGGPRISGSYRHLAYYLPEYRVYGLGHDLHGTFGQFFRAYQGSNDYHVQALELSRQVFALPPQVRYLIIPDAEIASRLDPGIPYLTHRLNDGTPVVLALVSPGTMLAFNDEGQMVAYVPGLAGGQPSLTDDRLNSRQ